MTQTVYLWGNKHRITETVTPLSRSVYVNIEMINCECGWSRWLTIHSTNFAQYGIEQYKRDVRNSERASALHKFSEHGGAIEITTGMGE